MMMRASAAQSRLHAHLAQVAVASVEGSRLPVPVAGFILWPAFTQLHKTRTWHGNGPNPISHSEIRAFCELTGETLRPVDIAGLLMIDDAWIVAFHDARRRKTDAAPLTAAGFDAVFS